MKRYLADMLTFMRLVLAVGLLTMAFVQAAPEAAFPMFVLGELTDALDGTCATRFPFPKNHVPKYRKYAPLYDMLADTLLAAAMGLYFILNINLVAGLTLVIGYVVLAVAIDLVVYGRLFGHPDTARAGALSLRNFKLAKKIILARRYLYVALIVIIAAATLYASGWPVAVKIGITVVALMVGLWLLRFIGQRARHITRNAVELEDKLEKKSGGAGKGADKTDKKGPRA